MKGNKIILNDGVTRIVDFYEFFGGMW